MIVRPERPSSTVRPEPELQKRNRRPRSAAAARRRRRLPGRSAGGARWVGAPLARGKRRREWLTRPLFPTCPQLRPRPRTSQYGVLSAPRAREGCARVVNAHLRRFATVAQGGLAKCRRYVHGSEKQFSSRNSDRSFCGRPQSTICGCSTKPGSDSCFVQRLWSTGKGNSVTSRCWIGRAGAQGDLYAQKYHHDLSGAFTTTNHSYYFARKHGNGPLDTTELPNVVLSEHG
jgi:hypothetical protein